MLSGRWIIDSRFYWQLICTIALTMIKSPKWRTRRLLTDQCKTVKQSSLMCYERKFREKKTTAVSSTGKKYKFACPSFYAKCFFPLSFTLIFSYRYKTHSSSCPLYKYVYLITATLISLFFWCLFLKYMQLIAQTWCWCKWQLCLLYFCIEFLETWTFF